MENQEQANNRIPHLLDTPAAVRFLSCEPLLGPLDLQEKSWFFPLGKQSPIDWVIVGGELGPGARPCDPAWIANIVRQCKAAGVACFVKQLGSNVVVSKPYIAGVVNNNYRLPLKDKKGGDPTEWSEDLRIREFPCVT